MSHVEMRIQDIGAGLVLLMVSLPDGTVYQRSFLTREAAEQAAARLDRRFTAAGLAREGLGESS